MILRIRQMLVKEFLQMFRDPRMRLVILVMPLVQLTVLAFALTTDVKNISTAVVDPDQHRRQPQPGVRISPAAAISASPIGSPPTKRFDG
jgi:hypothetical protein